MITISIVILTILTSMLRCIIMPPHTLKQGHSDEPVSGQHEDQWEDEKKQVKDDGID